MECLIFTLSYNVSLWPLLAWGSREAVMVGFMEEVARGLSLEG